MVETSHDAQKEAQRLLNVVSAKLDQFPNPTGMSVYKPRPSDVIVSTYPKAGTTLLQNMAYQIAVATGGAPSWDPDGTSFKDITEVAPWVDYGPEFGVLECDTNPRIFKTHGNAERFDQTKGTYIYCIRNPEHYPASWLDFLFDVLTKEDVNDMRVREAVFHRFVRKELLGFSDDTSSAQQDTRSEAATFQLGRWFTHVKGWIETPRRNVLILFYEDILRDLRGTVLCVAKFMNRTLSPEGLQTVLERCDRKAMAGNPKFFCNIEARGFGFEGRAEKAKLESKLGFKQFKFKKEDRLMLSTMIKIAFGVESYSEFQDLIRKRQQDNFPVTAYVNRGQKEDTNRVVVISMT